MSFFSRSCVTVRPLTSSSFSLKHGLHLLQIAGMDRVSWLVLAEGTLIDLLLFKRLQARFYTLYCLDKIVLAFILLFHTNKIVSLHYVLRIVQIDGYLRGFTESHIQYTTLIAMAITLPTGGMFCFALNLDLNF